MAATAYSNEFKDRAVKAFLTKGARSTLEISREFGVSHSTLYVWVSSSSYEAESCEPATSPERWQPSRRMQAITVYDSLAEEERGEFLRSNGLSLTHIEKWRQMLYSTLEVRDQEKVRLEKRIRELARRLSTSRRPCG